MATLLAGTAAAGTAAATTAAATTTATTMSTVMNIMSGAATLAAVIGTIGMANAEADALTQQAAFSEIEGGQERLQSFQRQTSMKRELLRVLGENDVSIAASGISLEGGIASESRRQAVDASSRELSIERDDDELRRALIKARANGLRTKAEGTRQAGLLKAFTQSASFAADLAERG